MKFWSRSTPVKAHNSSHSINSRVLVTRPARQADALCQLLVQQGFEPVRFPVIEIQPVDDEAQARQQLHHIVDADWVFFISANAVEHAHRLLGGSWPKLHAKIAAIGKKTALALENRGLVVDLIPEKRFTTENLIAKLNRTTLHQQRCYIIKGVGGRDALANQLEEQGAEVLCVDVYQRVKPDSAADAALPGLLSDGIGFVTITSQLALDHLLAMAGSDCQVRIKKTPMIVISERIARYARANGCTKVLLATQASDEGLVETLVSTTNNEMGTAL